MRHGSLADLPFDNASAAPDAVVLSRKTADGSWRDVTAREFAAEVMAVAKGLIAEGLVPGDRIAVMARTIYEWTVLDFAAGSDAAGNELTFITNLPSMAAAAHFHGKAQAGSVEQIVDEARAWALGPYASALLKGQKLQGEERAAIRRQLARFTGLNETYLEQADLRVTPDRFYKELLRDRGLTVGRLDSRYTGVDYDSAGESPDNDPSFYGIDAGYTAAINSWARGSLGFVTDREYQSIAGLGRRLGLADRRAGRQRLPQRHALLWARRCASRC